MSAPPSGAGQAASDAFGIWVPVEVRYSDLDAQSHANNAVFFTYFEQARISYFNRVRQIGRELVAAGALEPAGATRTAAVAPAATDDQLELPLVISEANCVYKRPIASLAPIVVGARTTRLARASLIIAYAVRAAPDGVLYASGSTTIVCVDPRTGRPQGLPHWAVAALRRLEPAIGT
jgi:acyl-CoA thioester hydrolase